MVEWKASGKGEDDKEYMILGFSMWWMNKNDEDQAGKWASVTCNVEWASGRAVAPADKVAVRSLYGGKIDNATVTTGAWNQIGTEDADAIAAGWKWDPCPA